jgi:hypothetical protein
MLMRRHSLTSNPSLRRRLKSWSNLDTRNLLTTMITRKVILNSILSLNKKKLRRRKTPSLKALSVK